MTRIQLEFDSWPQSSTEQQAADIFVRMHIFGYSSREINYWWFELHIVMSTMVCARWQRIFVLSM